MSRLSSYVALAIITTAAAEWMQMKNGQWAFGDPRMQYKAIVSCKDWCKEEKYQKLSVNTRCLWMDNCPDGFGYGCAGCPECTANPDYSVRKDITTVDNGPDARIRAYYRAGNAAREAVVKLENATLRGDQASGIADLKAKAQEAVSKLIPAAGRVDKMQDFLSVPRTGIAVMAADLTERLQARIDASKVGDVKSWDRDKVREDFQMSDSNFKKLWEQQMALYAYPYTHYTAPNPPYVMLEAQPGFQAAQKLKKTAAGKEPFFKSASGLIFASCAVTMTMCVGVVYNFRRLKEERDEMDARREYAVLA